MSNGCKKLKRKTEVKKLTVTNRERADDIVAADRLNDSHN